MKLRKLKEKDAINMLSWMHDDSINAVFATDFKSFDENKVQNFIKNSSNNEREIHYACVDENDEYLGTVTLKNIDRITRNAEYAISFCKKAHGTSAAKFATSEILRIAFTELNLQRVYLNVITENERANGFYKKYGFIFEGCFRKHILVKGELKDLNWYALTKEEYEINY